MKQNDNKPSEIKKKAVIYGRFSSRNQKEQSIKIQVNTCRAFAKWNGYEIVGKYCDRRQTGRNTNRQEFKKLLADSAKGMFDVVLVHKFDRWGRNIRDFMNAIYTLEQNGVLLHSVAEGAINSPQGKLMMTILAGFAEFESDRIAERIRGGQKETSLKGLHLGGIPPLGYSVDPSTQKYVINDKEAIIVKKIFDLYAGGVGYTEILKYLNSMNYRTKRGKPFVSNSLHDLLKNVKYTGTYTYGVIEYKIIDEKRHKKKRPPEEYTIIEGEIPAIIDKQTFDRVQLKLAENKKTAGRNKAREVYLLSGVINCGICGSPMHVNTRTDGYSSYNCSKKNHDVICTNKGIKRETLENYVIDTLYNELFSSTSARELAKLLNEHNKKMSIDAEAEIELARREVRKIKREINKLLDFVDSEDVNLKTVKAKLDELEQKRRYARQHLKNMEQQYELLPISEKMVLDLITESKKLLKAHNNENAVERRNFIRGYVKKVTVGNKIVKINYNIE